MRVAVQIFSYQETWDDITQTMDGYAACEIPAFVDEITYEACVTPSGVTASHPDAARAHPTFDLVETPKGKLASRNYAHDRAVDAGADVIVSGDADAPPVGRDYLVTLLEPLRDPHIVGVSGTEYDDNPFTFWLTHSAYYLDNLRKPMYGRNSAFTAEGWEYAGPFDEHGAVDVMVVRAEEEFEFRRRLEEIGGVKMVPEAKAYSNIRRFLCPVQRQFGKIGRSVPLHCQAQSNETFHPRR